MNRRPRRMRSTSAATSLIGIRAARLLFLFERLENLFDSILRRDGLIEKELELGRSAQRHAGAQEMPDIRGRSCQRFLRLLARRGVAGDRPIAARKREIRRDLATRDGDEADAGIRELSREDLADFFSNLCRDPLDAMRERHNAPTWPG